VWTVVIAPEFDTELQMLPARVLEIFGPAAKRPKVDTLKGSKHANMKELRFDADNGVWRVAFAFAFDPERKAVLLIAGDKSGVGERGFYRRLIAIADRRFDDHLADLKGRRGLV
jgi:hypothetical protein